MNADKRRGIGFSAQDCEHPVLNGFEQVCPSIYAQRTRANLREHLSAKCLTVIG